MKKQLLVLCAAILLLPAGLFAAGPVREGLWEITSQTEMPGMPSRIPPSTVTHCYTKEEVSDQKKMIARDKNCTVTDYKMSGNKVTWAMKCTGKGAGTFTGETVFGNDAYTSTMKMNTQGHNIKVKVKARRIGDCPAK